MAFPVKFYTSSHQGAPQLTNAWGDLVALLDACLVNGFNSKTITALTSVGGVATATIGAGHLNVVDQILTVAGADQAEYNGEVKVLSVNATQFTYAITGSPASPATTGSSMTAKVSPLGFAKAFTGTNKGAYRSPNVLSNRPYLRVDNSLDAAYTTTYAKKGKVTMAEGMTDIDTFTGARAPYDATVPTKNEAASGSGASVIDGWYKWYYARSTSNGSDSFGGGTAGNRNWVLVGDDRGFYLITSHEPSSTQRVVYTFSDFASYRPGDGFNTLLTATEMYSAANVSPNINSTNYNSSDFNCQMAKTGDATGKAVLRSHLQVGGYTRLNLASLQTVAAAFSVTGFATGIPWPNGPDYSLLLHPVYLQEETTGHLRGKLPGMMWVHNNNPLSDLTFVSNVAGYAGRKFLLVDGAYTVTSTLNTARFAFDITGPWW